MYVSTSWFCFNWVDDQSRKKLRLLFLSSEEVKYEQQQLQRGISRLAPIFPGFLFFDSICFFLYLFEWTHNWNVEVFFFFVCVCVCSHQPLLHCYHYLRPLNLLQRIVLSGNLKPFRLFLCLMTLKPPRLWTRRRSWWQSKCFLERRKQMLLSTLKVL